MLFSDEDRFGKALFSNPVDKQILFHAKSLTERHVGPGSYYTANEEEKRNGWASNTFSRRQPMAPSIYRRIKNNSSPNSSTRSELYTNGIIIADGLIALPTTDASSLPGPGQYNIDNHNISSHIKSLTKGASMGSSPRFACYPPFNVLRKDVLFSCSESNHYNIGPGEYNMFPSCELVKSSHNVRAIAASGASTAAKSMSVSKLNRIKAEGQSNLTTPKLAPSPTQPASKLAPSSMFDYSPPPTQDVKKVSSTFHSKKHNLNSNNNSPQNDGNSSNSSKNQIGAFSQHSVGAHSSEGRSFTPTSTPKLVMRTQPVVDVRMSFGLPGSTFRTAAVAQMLTPTPSQHHHSSLHSNTGSARQRRSDSGKTSHRSYNANSARSKHNSAHLDRPKSAGDLPSRGILSPATSGLHPLSANRPHEVQAWRSNEDDAVENLLTDGDASIHYLTGLNLVASPESGDVDVIRTEEEEIDLYNRYHNNHLQPEPNDDEVIES